MRICCSHLDNFELNYKSFVNSFIEGFTDSFRTIFKLTFQSPLFVKNFKTRKFPEKIRIEKAVNDFKKIYVFI